MLNHGNTGIGCPYHQDVGRSWGVEAENYQAKRGGLPTLSKALLNLAQKEDAGDMRAYMVRTYYDLVIRAQ